MGLRRQQFLTGVAVVAGGFVILGASSPSIARTEADRPHTAVVAEPMQSLPMALADLLVWTTAVSNAAAPAPTAPAGGVTTPRATSAPAGPTTAAPTTAVVVGPRPGTQAVVTKPSGGGADRIDEATARVRARFDWTKWLPGWRVDLLGERRGYKGSTFPDERLVQVYVRPSMTADQIAHVLAHELGHAVDVTYFDDTVRSAIQLARGRRADAQWWVESGTTDFASGSGDWAEMFSWWASGGRGRWLSTVGRPPSASEMVWIEATVRAVVGAGGS